MNRNALWAVLLGMALIVSSNTLAQVSKARLLLQDGINTETLDRDFDGAIALYEQALKEAEIAADKDVTARALLHLAKAHKNYGRSKARTYLDRLVGEFATSREAAEARDILKSLRDQRSTGGTAELSDRIIWEDSQVNPSGRVSFDGRFLSFIDRRNGSLNVRDLTNERNRNVIGARNGEIGPSAISRSGREIAYVWRPSAESNGELWVVGTDASRNRWVYSNTAIANFRPADWTHDGRIAVLASNKDGVSRIALVDLNGKVEPLKTFFDFQEPGGVFVSPDGKFIAYDVKSSATNSRDVNALSTDGGFIEYPLLQSIADARVLGWVDANVLVAGRRGDTVGVWAIATVNGKASGPPLLVRRQAEEIRSLGTSRAGELYYSLGGTQAYVLQNLTAGLVRLQGAPVQSQQTVDRRGTMEGVVVQWGTNEPIAGADVELTRLEGTTAAPLNPGAVEAFSALMNPSNTGPFPVADPPPPLAPEVQYAKTGDDGRFIFRNLKPGGYRLVAAHFKEPYSDAQYGQRDPRGPGFVFPLAEGEALQGLKLQMAPMGVITGRVYDIEGQPLSRAVVFAAKYHHKNGRRTLVNNFDVLTDDRGDYRIFGLPPGRYFVAAKVEDRSEVMISNNDMLSEDSGSPILTRRSLPDGEVIEETHGLVYFGGALSPDRARPIDLVPESPTRAGADIFLNAGAVRSHHIRGVLIDGANGRPVPGLQVRAVPRRQAPHVDVSFAMTGADGDFDLAGIVPGSYAVFSGSIGGPTFTPGQASLAAAVRNGGSLGARAITQIEVADADVQGLRLVIAPQLNIAGRVTVDGGTPAQGDPALARVSVSLIWDPDVMGMPNTGIGAVPAAFGTVRPDGGFSLRAWPGSYRVQVDGIPSGAYVKSVQLGDVDVLADGLRVQESTGTILEVTISSRSGAIEGTAVSPVGVSMPNVVIALIPETTSARQRKDLYRSAASDHAGKFQLERVPPGNYKLFAWEYAEPGSWEESQFLQDYEQLGKPIVVTEGKQQTQVSVIQRRR